MARNNSQFDWAVPRNNRKFACCYRRFSSHQFCDQRPQKRNFRSPDCKDGVPASRVGVEQSPMSTRGTRDAAADTGGRRFAIARGGATRRIGAGCGAPAISTGSEGRMKTMSEQASERFEIPKEMRSTGRGQP